MIHISRDGKNSSTENSLKLFCEMQAIANPAITSTKGSYDSNIKYELCQQNVGEKEYLYLLKLIFSNKIENGIPSIMDNDNAYIQHI